MKRFSGYRIGKKWQELEDMNTPDDLFQLKKKNH